jgi:hypothetical protein
MDRLLALTEELERQREAFRRRFPQAGDATH